MSKSTKTKLGTIAKNARLGPSGGNQTRYSSNLVQRSASCVTKVVAESLASSSALDWQHSGFDIQLENKCHYNFFFCFVCKDFSPR